MQELLSSPWAIIWMAVVVIIYCYVLVTAMSKAYFDQKYYFHQKMCRSIETLTEN